MEKWSGLGMGLFSTSDNIYPYELSSSFDSWLDELLANGFTQIRLDITYSGTSTAIAVSKLGVLAAVAKGIQVIWGVSSGGVTITSSNWPTCRQAILDAAQWAQDNGVYEFQLGNEEESYVDGITMTVNQIITNLKSVATDVQSIFTRGNVSYSFGYTGQAPWILAGRGEIDLMGRNIYMGGSGSYSNFYQSEILDLVTAFGSDHTYLSEFNLSITSLDDYSPSESVQASGIKEMLDYIKTLGLIRAFFFIYYDDSRPFYSSLGLGILKTNGTYRKLWWLSLLSQRIPVSSRTNISRISVTRVAVARTTV